MTLTNMLKTGMRAGVVALVVAGTAITAVPAQAASPSFGFSLNFGAPGPKGNVQLHFGDRNYWRVCLSDAQLRTALRRNGYSDMRIVREDRRGNTVFAVARKHNHWYSMRIDRCTGKVDRVREIQRNRNGSFNLSFSF